MSTEHQQIETTNNQQKKSRVNKLEIIANKNSTVNWDPKSEKKISTNADTFSALYCLYHPAKAKQRERKQRINQSKNQDKSCCLIEINEIRFAETDRQRTRRWMLIFVCIRSMRWCELSFVLQWTRFRSPSPHCKMCTNSSVTSTKYSPCTLCVGTVNLWMMY